MMPAEMSSEDNLKCPECSEKFLNWPDHVAHAAIHGESMLPLQVVDNSEHTGRRDPLRKPHKCELCYKSFSTEERLKVIFLRTFLKRVAATTKTALPYKIFLRLRGCVCLQTSVCVSRIIM